MKFEINNGSVLVDGHPTQIIAGAMHYFRIVPELWHDRLTKLKQCGLNTVETYACWNLHEQKEGNFDFSGRLDIAGFIAMAGSMGLMVIVRPGPYICSEWDLGGLPAWLLTKPGIALRRNSQAYLAATGNYFRALMEQIRPLMCDNGGPIIAMQVENEFGCFANDKAHLESIAGILRRLGANCQFLTSDPACEHFDAGTLPGIAATINFRNDPETNLKMLRRLRPEGPDFIMEYWSGSAHIWGKPFYRRAASEVGKETEWMLKNGCSMSFYMFHGGTDFGFMNGARLDDGVYHPCITSYDVDAPLNENGDPTEKYFAIQKAIKKCFPETETAIPSVSRKISYGKVKLDKWTSLFNALPQLSKPVNGVNPLSMEELGQAYGYVLYRTAIWGPVNDGILTFDKIRDRAQVFADGRLIATLDRNDKELKANIGIIPEGSFRQVDVLVENMGRVCCGDRLQSDAPRGIIGHVSRWRQFVEGWEMWPLPLQDLSRVCFDNRPVSLGQPMLYQGEFEIDEIADTFLNVSSGEKGICWINGFNLGRYWNIGPQRTLYVPGPLLRKGRNTVTVFEQYGLSVPEVVFKDSHEFSHQVPLTV